VLTRKGAARISNIRQLEGQRVAIPSGWSIIDTLRKHFPQIRVVEVDDVKGMFQAVREGAADAGIDIAAFLEYTAREFFLTDVAVHSPLDFGAVAVANGLHYIVSPQRKGVAALINLALANISKKQRRALNAHWLVSGEGRHRQMSTVPYQELVTMASEPAGLNRLQQVVLDGEKHFVYVKAISKSPVSQDYFAVITPVASVMAPAVAKVKTAVMITAGCFVLLLPVVVWLSSLIVTPVKQLARENEKIQERRYRELNPVMSRIVEIDALNTSLMAMARSIEKHAREQEALMDSFIELIAQAIDDKSPYTAGHCARVPQLAMMLARKAEDSGEPPFDQFKFEGEQEWREFRIGAWLHDCGKITTPEHIVDKGTKLETIYNRIHEIRMRFEVLWRDAEIEYLTGRLARPEDQALLHQVLEQRRIWLQEAFAFIARCNVGGEFMEEGDRQRLDELSKVRWQRHFDDRIGLSHVERARVGESEVTLPVTESLLADKTWHIIEREHGTDYDAHLGIRMDVPEYLYNRGELYNLKIARGTLTAEDRFKINEHMISTIKMLDKLPLPEELQRVPRYASTHHETLDGRGYPRKLSAQDLSIPERIMVLADIFEALTAADRPYKAAKPVSVALDILYKMVQNHHVDSDVFRLFLTSGVYLEYAKRFLPEKQLDDIDTSKYLA
jgi:HD-GYP domain-containing protein (c-di-GMP phosphodiesterase class II)